MEAITEGLSPTQAAIKLGLSPQSVRRMIERGQLPAVRTSLGHLIDPRAVDAMAAQRRIETRT